MAAPLPDWSQRSERVRSIVTAYLEQVQAGTAPPLGELLTEHPDLADDIQEALTRSLASGAHPGGSGTCTLDPTAAQQSGPLPTRFGDYELLGEIARGGMGIVYRARQLSLSRIVALKMVLQGEQARAAELQRFRTEAEAAASLDHPHIVPIYEVGEYRSKNVTAPVPYFTMKLIEGGRMADGGDPGQTRKAELQRQRWLAGVVAKVARAVHYAHQRGILHRDLKPANILLDVAGEPYVTDFGLAKQLTRQDGSEGLTRTGMVVGTPSYMPPEQARGQKGLTTAADVYSLGAVLYKLLTGKPPFRGRSTVETLLLVMQQEPERPSKHLPQLDPDLETICLKCLEKEPARRYTSAEALAQDLERWLAGEPLRARPSGWPERTVKWCRRRPAAAALLGVSFLALLAVLVLGALLYQGQLAQTAVALKHQQERAEEQGRLARQQGEIARQQTAIADQQKLAAAQETLARQAVEKEREQTARQLEETQRSLFTAQVWRAAGLWQREPAEALALLENPSICPPAQRDFIWGYYHRLSQRQAVSLQGHQGEVACLAVTRDGQTLATGGRDGLLKLWNLKDRSELSTLRHGGQVWAVAFSADGETLYSAGPEGTIKVWDLADGTEVQSLTGHKCAIFALAVSPDGKILASGGGHRLDTGSTRWRQGELKLWDLEKGTARSLAQNFNAAFLCLSFSQDGRYLAAGGSVSSQAHVWDMSNLGKPGVSNILNAGWVQGIAFGPDSRTLAVGRADHLLHICEVTRDPAGGPPRVLQRLPIKGPIEEVASTAFSPDGFMVASVDYHGTLRLNDPATGIERTVFRPKWASHSYDGPARPILFTPDGKLLVQGHGQQVLLWPAAGHSESVTLAAPQTRLLAISADGKTLASAGAEAHLKLWDPVSGRSLGQRPTGGVVRAMAWSPSGQTLAVYVAGGPKGKTGANEVRFWFSPTATVATTIPVEEPLTALTFGLDGRTLYALASGGGSSYQLRRWDVQGKKKVTAREPILIPNLGSQVLLASDADSLLCSDNRGRLLSYDLPSGKTSSFVDVQAGTLTALSPDRTRLAVLTTRRGRPGQGTQRTIRILDLTGKVAPVDVEPFDVQVMALAFSPDNRTLAGGCYEDRNLRLWETASGKLRGLLRGHTREVRAVAFTPDGQTLVSGAGYVGGADWVKGGEIKLWRTSATQSQEEAPDGGEGEAWIVRARLLRGQGQWQAALAACNRALELSPGSVKVLEERGIVYTRLGDFARASADLPKVAKKGSKLDLVFQAAAVLLLDGKEAEYRKVCAGPGKRTGKTGDLAKVARIWTLGDRSVEPQKLSELTRELVALSPKMGWQRRALALALVRAGNPAEAIRLQPEVLKGKKGAVTAKALSWLILSLAYQRQGDLGKARDWFTQASTWLDKAKAEQAETALTPGGLSFSDWLECLVLRREVERLLAVEKKS